MARKDDWPVDMDSLAEKLQDKLEHVKLGDVTDAVFKGGVWASCVVGTKFLLDFVTEAEMFKWAQDNPALVDSALKSYFTMSVTGGFWPADIARIYKSYLDDPFTEAELQAIASAVDEYHAFGLWGTGERKAQVKLLYNPLLLAKMTLTGPEKIKDAMKVKADAVALVASSRAYWEGEVVARQNRLEAYKLQIAEFGHGSLSYEEQQDYASLQRGAEDVGSIAHALKKLAEAEKAEANALDAEATFKAAKDKAFNMLKWAVALVIGTYLAGSMVYAGDTLLDSIQSMFTMFKIPFKGGV